MNTKNGMLIPVCMLFACLVCVTCSRQQEYQLGIQVPVGNQHVSDETPYLISGVYEDSPAYKAGLRPDDIILQVDGVDLKGLRCDYIYQRLLLGKKGTDMSVVVDRKGQKLVFIVRRGG